jgi:hypothetical protein
MKGIRHILHTMGEALTLASAGEMLTDTDKDAVLERFPGRYPVAPDAVLPRVVVASDQHFTPGLLRQGIELCNENRAMLDLLCISRRERGSPVTLTEVLPRLASEPGLDFQVTRRQGDLLVEIDAYLRLRRDTLIILIQVGEDLRRRAECYRQGLRWSSASQKTAVSLYEEVPATCAAAGMLQRVVGEMQDSPQCQPGLFGRQGASSLVAEKRVYIWC